jgi:hypothetical protein
VSEMFSPRAIIVRSTIIYQHHCKLEFGMYVQTHEQHDSSMDTRTTGAIALRPTRNSQGGFYFYSLNTGRVVRRNHWTVLPMPGEVIIRIHEIAQRNPANVGRLQILYRGGVPISGPDSDSDSNVDPNWDPEDA